MQQNMFFLSKLSLIFNNFYKIVNVFSQKDSRTSYNSSVPPIRQSAKKTANEKDGGHEKGGWYICYFTEQYLSNLHSFHTSETGHRTQY